MTSGRVEPSAILHRSRPPLKRRALSEHGEQRCPAVRHRGHGAVRLSDTADTARRGRSAARAARPRLRENNARLHNVTNLRRRRGVAT